MDWWMDEGDPGPQALVAIDKFMQVVYGDSAVTDDKGNITPYAIGVPIYINNEYQGEIVGIVCEKFTNTSSTIYTYTIRSYE